MSDTHPNLSVVVPRRQAPVVPGEPAAPHAVLVAAQGMYAQPGITAPQLGAEGTALDRGHTHVDQWTGVTHMWTNGQGSHT